MQSGSASRMLFAVSASTLELDVELATLLQEPVEEPQGEADVSGKAALEVLMSSEFTLMAPAGAANLMNTPPVEPRSKIKCSRTQSGIFYPRGKRALDRVTQCELW